MTRSVDQDVKLRKQIVQ